MRRERAVLVVPHRREEGDVEEMVRLAETAGAEVAAVLTPKLRTVDAARWLSSGWVERLKAEVAAVAAEVVLFDAEPSPAQVTALEGAVGARVVTRTELILDIFAQHARTAEAKIQVESAQLAYLLPRLSGRGISMSRLGGGIGTRGPGETQLETDRRHIRRRLTVLRRRLADIERRRALLRGGRSGLSAALVGYTNAGKTTLLNLLARERFRAEDALFVTLDPVVRRVWLGEGTMLMLSDTVGFIERLPPGLVASFRATLGEVVAAAFLVHVVDASDGNPEGRMAVTESILGELDVLEKPRILVFNKVDRAEEGALERLKLSWPEAVFVSARTGEGLEMLRRRLTEAAVSVGYGDARRR